MLNDTARYKDIDINFTPHPSTGDISVLKNENAINKSMRNLILTNFYERLHEYDKCGNVEGMLFELPGASLENDLKLRIENTILNYEPRIELHDVYVSHKENINAFEVRIYYSAMVSDEPIEFTFMLERVI